MDTEITAKGAALLAGLKSGLYDDNTMIESWKVECSFEPTMSETNRQTHLGKWQDAMTRALTQL
jgi:glycerol kinase